MDSPTHLKRHLNTVTLTFYGVGVIVGAGIYVLVGKLAGLAGNGLWLAFVLSAVAALPTGLSYAELSSRYPKSAGEAVFADRAFKNDTLSFSVGFLIMASGIASTAALSHGFAAYFGQLFPVPPVISILVFLGVLTALNHRGIKEATWANVVCTLISVGALVAIIVAGVGHWGSVDLLEISQPLGEASIPINLLISAAALAFYAFIGFEDICNVAEEVRKPRKTIPRAILFSLLITSILYVGIGVTVVSIVPVSELAASKVPLALVAEKLWPGVSPHWLSFVALFAVFNSALLNMVMASRILYGMGREGWIPNHFGRIHIRRQTPTWGVVTAGVLAAAFALTGFLKVLAEATNTIILAAFFMVNFSLLIVKLKKRPADENVMEYFQVPLIVPILGMFVTAFMVAQFTPGAYLRAFGLLSLGFVLYAIHSRKN